MCDLDPLETCLALLIVILNKIFVFASLGVGSLEEIVALLKVLFLSDL